MRFTLITLLTALVLVAVLTSCQSAVATGSAAQSSAPSSAPSGAAPNVLEGTVLETIDTASYTYLRLEVEDGDIWAAVPRTAVKAGTKVTIADPMRMDGFQSESLGRSFDRIVFGSLADSPSTPQPMPSGHADMPPGHPTTGGSAADHGAISVGKADDPDARTIAELFELRSDLSDKTVVLRGKVVKSNTAILGRNWIHLQDGTGEAANGTHDITVTSSDTAQLGEVVIVRGLVRLDKDFGAGYSYPIIVEEATIER